METTNSLQERTIQFIAPSGHSYTIREQNGDDDDVLSNSQRATTLQNLSDFASGIVVKTSRTNGRLTPDQVHALPSNDRYAILFNSRIFSLGKTAEFVYDWGKENGGKATYEQDISDFLFDYSAVPTEEVLNEKPNAIPFYPEPEKETEIEFTLTSGKVIYFDLLTGAGESYLIGLPVRTKNSELKARNIKLVVNGKPEAIENFKMFSVMDMREIREKVASVDPLFTGQMDVENPNNPSQKAWLNVIAIPSFFYPGEI